LQEVRAGAGENELASFDQFANGFSDAAEELNGLLSDANDQALALRESLLHAHGQPADLSTRNEPAEEAATTAPNGGCQCGDGRPPGCWREV